MKEYTQYKESELMTISGWFAIIILILSLAFVYFINAGVVGFGIIGLFFITCINGFFIINPNEAIVTTFFGNYTGTKKEVGFYWMNPLNNKIKISVKIQNLATHQLKVNDKNGNPIEIAAVFVWKIEDTAKASFATENYLAFLKNQCESALRKMASHYSYDGEEPITLKNNIDEISKNLKDNLTKLINFTGIEIEDARLTHLAYAPEIAQVMLRKQQAEAIIAARQKIVAGAINMVEDVLKEMEKRKIASFDNDAKLKLITNLMTVLVGENEVQPMIQLEK